MRSTSHFDKTSLSKCVAKLCERELCVRELCVRELCEKVARERCGLRKRCECVRVKEMVSQRLL